MNVHFENDIILLCKLRVIFYFFTENSSIILLQHDIERKRKRSLVRLMSVICGGSANIYKTSLKWYAV